MRVSGSKIVADFKKKSITNRRKLKKEKSKQFWKAREAWIELRLKILQKYKMTFLPPKTVDGMQNQIKQAKRILNGD